MLSRRQCLSGLLSFPVAGLGQSTVSLAQADQNLAALAREKNMFFGAAITLEKIEKNNQLRKLYDSQCDVWVPEGEMQWENLEPSVGVRDFTTITKIADIAKERGKKLRGHSLLWYALTPVWFAEYDNSIQTWQSIVEPHLVATSQQFANDFVSWDVLNEPLDVDDGLPYGLRNSRYYQMLGVDYIGQAFEISRAFAPNVTRYLNEYSLTQDVSWHESKRRAFLDLLDSLLAKQVPIEGIGIQTHLETNLDFDAEIYRKFLQEITDRGLEITLTELDVRENKEISESLSQRQKRVADLTYDVLSVAFDQPAVKGLMCWALSDRHSWLRRVIKIKDNNGLPYDDEYLPTPMHGAIARAFKDAPPRASI